MILTTKQIQDKYLDRYGKGDITEMLIEFAKFHVEQALIASKLNSMKYMKLGEGHIKYVESLILNSYPLDNIK